MKAEQIRDLALAFVDCETASEFVQEVRKTRYSIEAVILFAQLETAAQLAEANEREAAKPKSIFPDLTKAGTQLPTVWNSPMPMVPVYTAPTTTGAPFISGLSPALTISATPTTPAAPATLCQHTSE